MTSAIKSPYKFHINSMEFFPEMEVKLQSYCGCLRNPNHHMKTVVYIYIYTYIRPYRVISIVYRVSYIYSLYIYIYTHPIYIYILYICIYILYIYIQYPLSIGFQPSQIGADEIIPSRGSPRCHRSTELFHGGSGGAEVPRSVFFAGYSIGLRENLNRKPMGFYHQIWGLSCKFSHHPIL